MQQFVKKFLSEGLDSDGAEYLVAPNKFISGQNFRTWSTNIGQIGYIENILKTAEKVNILPSGGVNTNIGFAADDENGWIIKFNQNSNGDDGIYLYDIVGDAWYKVLMSADVTGGLNFNKYSLINGAYVVNGILYWNDADNQPRKLNLAAFMGAYSSSHPGAADYTISLPIDETEITLIRKPQAYPPSIIKMLDSGFVNNFIKNESYQFAERWVHFDGEEAVLSTWSKSSLLNKSDEEYNYVHVSLNRIEDVPQTVRLLQLVAINSLQDGEGNIGYVIKQWDRLISSENAEINGSVLEFDFYGNLTGEVVDSATLVRPYHTVPLQSETQERGKNRTILLNNLEGYDTPATTSLSLSLPSPVTLGFTTLNKFLVEIKHRNGRVGAEAYAYIGYFVYLTEVLPVGWYEVAGTGILNSSSGTYPTIGSPAPTTGTLASLRYCGADLTAVVYATAKAGTWRWDGPFLLYTTGPYSITGISTTTYGVFLPESQYKAGVVFYDKYLRKTGVVFTDDIIDIPARNYAFSAGYASFEWTLSYANALAEIPDTAYYYSVVRTLNQITRFFVAGFDNAVRYATFNTTTQLLEFTATTYATNAVAVAVNRNALLQANLGYVAQDGDQCILIDNSNNKYELPVIGEEGEYVLLKPIDVGNTTSKTWVYRLYTPYKTSEQEPFFEMGDMYAVTDAGTSSRTYSILQGSFRADTVALTRVFNATTYFAEAMNPNDTYFQRWDTDAGRPNLVTKLGQVRYDTGLRFSNVYIQGTNTNGLSAFDALDREILPEDMGSITKAVITTKVQKDGSVLLVIGEQETASVYLGETEVFDADGGSFLAKSDKFIGQVNILRGGYGTSNHESVIVHDGNVSWFCKLRGCFVSYSNQGLFPISNYGLIRVAKLFASKYASLSVSEIEALGSRPFVFGGYDPYHKELFWSIPSTTATPPKGYLQDYTSPDFPVIYPYDIYDGVAKVLVFKPGEDKWGAPHSYQIEGYVAIRDFIFSAKNGALYQHNVNDGTANTFNNWFGVDAKTEIGLIINENPNIVKEFLTLSVEGNGVQPTWTHCRTELPNVQSSDLVDEWVEREGVFYAATNRDRLSPNATGSYDEKLYKGDVLRGQWMKCYFEYDTQAQLQIRFHNCGYRVSDGHTT